MPLSGTFREPEIETTRVTIHIGLEGCAVDMDATPVGKTDAQGVLFLQDIEPTDHYIHVRCPRQEEMTFFVSPKEGQNLELHPGSRSSTAAAPAGSPLEAAEAKIQLRQLIQDAVRLRARGHIEEAVQRLREAAIMDPENSDLHRELGITFLLVKEWKRARVEMLEAIRHDPSDSDAHNGLGYALEKLGDLDAALKEYRTATQLDPDDSSYRQHYIDALSKTAGEQTEKKK
ncbi:MAG TPA: tetratricopeptide repeat protein [Terriglobia bacterium]|nr:tetratricopeptide repeat protein [Terriglobia bacterium]